MHSPKLSMSTLRPVILCACYLALCGCRLPAAAQASGLAPDSSRIAPIIEAVRARDFDKALELSQTALRKDPRDYRILTLRGMAYAGKGTLPLALNSYGQALKLSPNYLPALEGEAQSQYQLGTPSAKQSILRVLRLRPGDPTSLAMLGFLEYRQDNCPSAISDFENAQPVLATQPIAQAAFATCLARGGQYDRSIPLLQQALVSAPAPAAASIRLNLALAQWKAGRPAEALATLQPVIENNDQRDQNVDDALLLAADIHESVNETQLAIELIRRVILAHPTRVDAYLAFANLSYDHSSMQVGIDILNVGIQQLPGEARLYLVRGILYTQLGKYEEATQDFSTADHLHAHLALLGAAEGLSASQQHNGSEALSKFRAAVKAQPDDALANYLLAEALAEQSPDEGTPLYVEEENAAQRACKADPSMSAAHDLLAGIYLQDGHADLALQQSQLALQYDPKDQEALYHSVLALRKTGDKSRIASLLKQLAALRTSTQPEQTQNRRYELEEVPPASNAH